MALPNIFNKEVNEAIINRIENLSSDSKPIWGKMAVSQMLAHCCVTYQYIYEPQVFKKPNALFKLVLKLFVKKVVTNEEAYKRNSGTGPDFIIKDKKNFNVEKARLIAYLRQVQEDGESFFDGKESFSFGRLNKIEWNNMFYKHINHHLTQFGV
jgi:hypothetical protein